MIVFASISLFLKRIFWFCIDNWRVLLPILGVLVAVILVNRACSKPKGIDIKDVEAIDKINRGNETERRKQLEKVIVENQEVISTVDERNTIAAESEAEKQAAIWAKINDADAKIAEAKRQGRDVTQDELECILVPENCK